MDDCLCRADPGINRIDHLLHTREDIAMHPPDATRTGDLDSVYFYRPGELLVGAADVEEVARALAELRVSVCRRAEPVDGVAHLVVSSRHGVPDLIARLRRSAGRPLALTPNHVLFGCQGSWHFSPATEPRPAPVPPEDDDSRGDWGATVIAVVDTGLAADAASLPPLDQGVGPGPDGRFEDPDEDHDGLLDAEAGHGTFVAGVIRLRATGAPIVAARVLDSEGVVDEVSLAQQIGSLLEVGPEILNLSLGGYTREDQPLLALSWLEEHERRPLIVAAAGNNSQSRPFYPAALSWVVGVGAVDVVVVEEDLTVLEEMEIDPDGKGAEAVEVIEEIEVDEYVAVRAAFSNFGPWVDCCAPGVDIDSTYQSGISRSPSDGMLRAFSGGATWSGTSFAAPQVSGAVADHMHQHAGTSAATAMQAILAGAPDGPPGLGKLVL